MTCGFFYLYSLLKPGLAEGATGGVTGGVRGGVRGGVGGVRGGVGGVRGGVRGGVGPPTSRQYSRRPTVEAEEERTSAAYTRKVTLG
eukprot:18699-Prorocentrum_minimum.AAC.1